MAAAQEIALRAKGLGSPGYLEGELLPRAEQAMQPSSARLRSEGRDKDLKSFRKHVLSVGRFMDNGRYNQVFLPFVKENL